MLLLLLLRGAARQVGATTLAPVKSNVYGITAFASFTGSLNLSFSHNTAHHTITTFTALAHYTVRYPDTGQELYAVIRAR